MDILNSGVPLARHIDEFVLLPHSTNLLNVILSILSDLLDCLCESLAGSKTRIFRYTCSRAIRPRKITSCRDFDLWHLYASIPGHLAEGGLLLWDSNSLSRTIT